jgi:pimeloyl-ACP methyl ester carboxylesterase
MPSPHEESTNEPVTSRRGFFWTGAERVDGPWGTVIRGPMYVEWEAPPEVTKPLPIVLIHGGGGQGLDWIQSYDGRPGWAPLLVQRGYAVYVVDRPCHGRSSYHPDVVGPMGAPFPFQAGEGIFRSPTEGPGSHPTAHLHTQWTGGGDPVDDPALAAIVTSSGPLPADLAVSQQLDQSRGAELLDRIGPAIVFCHSLGGPAGWLIADARPDLVKALVSIEAVGPPFAQVPPLGLDLKWGITQAPITYDPPAEDPAELEGKPRRLPNLAKVPIATMSAPASPFRHVHDAMDEFLRAAGCEVETIKLDERGVEGNGHAMMLERNNVEALEPVIGWVEDTVGG